MAPLSNSVAATMLGCSTSTSAHAQSTIPQNSTELNKHDRNKAYYQKNKTTIKENKAQYGFKIEVNKDEECRLAEIRKQVNIVRNQLLSNGKSGGNVDVMEALLDCWNSRSQNSSSAQPPKSFQTNISTRTFSSLDRDIRPPEIMCQPKTQLHSSCNEKDDIYLVCGSALQRLFGYFFDGNARCKCGENFDLSTLNINRITKNNHCVKVEWKCNRNGHRIEWFSSSIISGKYYVNMR